VIETTCYLCKGSGRIECSALNRALESIPVDQWVTTVAASEAANRDQSEYAALLADLLKRGLVERRGKGVRGAPYEWRRLP
jgi:hypothetical protein